MIVYRVIVHVTNGRIRDFIAATKENHAATRKEPGNLRFDVLRKAGEPSEFLLYEVYISKEAVAAHKKTPHYMKWRDTVADWMAQPREGIEYEVVCPPDESAW